ncbi:hypothetical protein DCAR_0101014 [Daucus carota subsp. sativus]|uniref:Uncharacterized protein n=1 Tax=Daucus carota subsp. sativus TaxID=79200 RepID=A0A175YB73_DAUCS|nr:hypothetical protein DCAR_0101014 [Daucus carota subsp. sativus]
MYSFFLIVHSSVSVLSFNKYWGKVVGVKKLYEDFGLEGGELLVFEYSGDGKDCCEVDYPTVVRSMPNTQLRKVCLLKGGLRFVKFFSEVDPVNDVMVAPASFTERCVSTMPLKFFVRYVLPNGKKIAGYYDDFTRKLSGLQPMSHLLGDSHLNSINMLLGCFRIKVQPFMLLKYCHGVDIPTEYKELWHLWSKTDYITVYSGTAKWILQIRHRRDWQRTTIHAGWISFWEDMGLSVGDICIFECPTDSFSHFAVRVQKALE